MLSPLAFIAATLALSMTNVAATGTYDPSSAVSLLDYSPSFTSPTGGEIWQAGKQYNATWDAKLPPGVNASEVAQTADLHLGWVSSNTSDLNQHIGWTLAKNISLYPPHSNTVTFTLPHDLQVRTSYILLLIGSSRDTSPEFTIIGSKPGDDAAKEPVRLARMLRQYRSTTGQSA